MAKNIQNISIDYVNRHAESEMQYYVDDNIYITMNARDFGFKHLKIGQPYRIDEGRVMAVTHGWVRVVINLEEHVLSESMIAVLVPNSIFEITAWSDDLDIRAFSFKNLPILISLDHQVAITLGADERQLVEEYFSLIWHEVNRHPLLLESVTHLQTALLLELKRIAEHENDLRKKSETRHEAQFHRFLSLVNRHGLKERKIEFYADKMCLTPNHLGSVIKQVSGLTIMQWLNRHAIQEAKILLKYSDMPIWEIAERMNFANPSFFSKFFKSEVGMTPGDYRRS